MNKKLILAMVATVASSGAFAAVCSGTTALTSTGTSATGTTGEMCVCNGNAAAKNAVLGGSGTPVTASVSFIKNGFDMQCSSNTFVSFQEHSATLFGVAAGSAKGNQTVRGNSNGGAIGVSAKCTGTNNNCTAGDVTTAIGLSSS